MKQVLHLTGRDKWAFIAKRATLWLTAIGMTAAAGYLGYLLINVKADMRVQNAEAMAQIQVLEGQLEQLGAEKIGLELEQADLTNADNLPSKFKTPR